MVFAFFCLHREAKWITYNFLYIIVVGEFKQCFSFSVDFDDCTIYNYKDLK